jgi:cell division protease FtsH
MPVPPSPADRPEREGPRPLPRPGLAGGAAELRGLDTPEKPELA